MATLDQAIDGNPGGLRGGTSSPQFTGLHRIEYGLWTGQPLSSLQPYASRLQADVAGCARFSPTCRSCRSTTPPAGTRSSRTRPRPAHRNRRPLERRRRARHRVRAGRHAGGHQDAEPDAASTASRCCRCHHAAGRAELDAVVSKTDHGGALPSNSELSQTESERLNASIGEALEALAQVPGALETASTPAIPQIPADQTSRPVKKVDRRPSWRARAWCWAPPAPPHTWTCPGGGAASAARRSRRPRPARPRPAPTCPRRSRSPGVHQSGILNPAPAQATLVALDSLAPTRAR